MTKHCLMLSMIALCGCTYTPPERSAASYANAATYPDDSASHPRRDELQAYLDNAVREGLPGAMLLVRSAEHGTWTGAAGWADIANQVPLRPEMLARVGSITKMFAAAVVLTLCEQQHISLSGPARDYLPASVVSNIENAHTVRIRQLLNHTSGIFNYLESSDLFLEAAGSYDYEYQSKTELLEYAYDEDADFEPGESWHYTNTPYLMLELIAERLGRRSSEELMRDLVIEPLSLRSTSYAPSRPPPANVVRGYSDIFGDGALIDVTDTALERFHFDGGIVSNVYEVADFVEALLDGRLLSSEAREELLAFVRTRGNSKRGTDLYGAGLIAEEHPEYGRILGHSGTAMGYSAHAYHIERYGVTFVAIVNASQHSMEERSYRWFSPLEHDDIVRLAVGE